MGLMKKLPVVNSDSSRRATVPKFKKRRVYGVRDFPPGCGPRVVNTTRMEAVVASVGHGENEVEFHRNEKIFDDSEKSVNGLKMKIVLAVEGAPGDVSPASLRSFSAPRAPIVIASADEIAAQTYPPRRRISAIRDFPKFCGPNIHKAILSSQNNNLGPEESGFERNSFGRGTRALVKQSGESLEHGPAIRSKFGGIVSLEIDDKVSYEPGTDANLVASSEMGIDQQETKEKASQHFQACNLDQPDQKSSIVNKRSDTDVAASEKKVGKQVTIHAKEKSLKIKILNIPNVQDQLKSDLGSGVRGSQVEKLDLTGGEKSKPISKLKRNALDVSRGKSTMKKLPPIGKGAYKDNHEILVDKMEGTTEGGRGVSNGAVTRKNVRETLRLFHAICRKVLHKNELMLNGDSGYIKRIDLAAARVIKKKGKCVNMGKQIMGQVPGVEVGDEFHYRVELNIVGLHRPTQGGIDYLRQGSEIFTTSIVASGGYADNLENSDTLIYCGAGGNMVNGVKQPEDQKLERGNLALKNSKYKKNPVRVIHGESKALESSDGKAKVVMMYTYDGLYVVHNYWQELGPHGKLVFKFQLNRIPGQPPIAWKEVRKTKKFKVREGLCVDDISKGKELMPICAVNTFDKENPPPFEYITSMIYPSSYCPTPPVGCDCVDGCFSPERCSCAIENGRAIPYNRNGAIVEAKPLVYECGPSCGCPPSCYNRVSQHGIKFQLEIFKTEARGWGVRSLNSISSGSFICEYIGELLEEKEADQRTNNDEYLFDIGHNYNDGTLWDGCSSPIWNASEGMKDDGFTIDAVHFGNVGRFINHSCSPNLYAQNVLYDHADKKMPHIMLFAAENIPPLQELTYHYDYAVDQVLDPNGNSKKKYCYCGSSGCTGRMY